MRLSTPISVLLSAACIACLVGFRPAPYPDTRIEGRWEGDLAGSELNLETYAAEDQEEPLIIRLDAAAIPPPPGGESSGGAAGAAGAPTEAVTFEVRRDPGLLRFSGICREGRGRGEFVFLPDPAFVRSLEALGFRAATLLDQLRLAARDVLLEDAVRLARAGYENLSAEDLIRLLNPRGAGAIPAGMGLLGIRDLGPLRHDLPPRE